MGGLAHKRLAVELVNLVRHFYLNLSSTLAERTNCLDKEQIILCISLSVFTHSVASCLSPLVDYLDMVQGQSQFSMVSGTV